MEIDEKVSKTAASANAAFYDSENTEKYLEVAPHIKHPSLRNMYNELISQVYQAASQFGNPRILDIGAGEGSATLPFLQLGGEVTAIDISPNMQEVLRSSQIVPVVTSVGGGSCSVGRRDKFYFDSVYAKACEPALMPSGTPGTVR